jgi:hypothetical protein
VRVLVAYGGRVERTLTGRYSNVALLNLYEEYTQAALLAVKKAYSGRAQGPGGWYRPRSAGCRRVSQQKGTRICPP